ncbi:BACON domain-containing protein [Pseudoflavitalea rhizosphaerae]|uniref:BACON domain-containing protein n=1 Tax=Pseudoflavitalea rhizosphaerae TaxID=1884793 RepID=UPI000F8DF34B|nr:BACON domain-containing protein [Pseudoflavitalea rhizosphaerae]
MKKIFLVWMAGTILLLNACSKNDSTAEPTPENKDLTILGLVDFVAEFPITATGGWTVEIPADADWLEVDKKIGTGDATLQFKCTKASTGTALQAVVKVILNGRIIHLTVKQEAFYTSAGTSMFGGESYDDIGKILPTADGGYIMVGATASRTGLFNGNPDPGMTEAFAIKFNEAGTVVWKKFYGGNRNDEFSGIAPTKDGGFVIVGRSASNTGAFAGNKGGPDIWVQKIDKDGNPGWMRLFGSTDQDSGGDVLVLDDETIIVSGVGGGNNHDFASTHGGDGDVWIACLDKDGNTKWKKCYGGSDYESGRVKLIPSSDGNFIFSAFTQSTDGDLEGVTGGGEQDGWLCKIDDHSNVLWSKKIGGSGDDVIVAMIPTDDGGALIAGGAGTGNFYGATITDNRDGFVMKVNGEGVRQWSTTVNEGANESFLSLTRYKGNSIAIAGSHYSEAGLDGLLCFMDGTGKKLWTRKIAGNNTDVINNIITLKNNSVVGAGYSTSTGGDIPKNEGDFDIFFHNFR